MRAVPGRLYMIEGCVSTNATYGDSFRPLTMYRLEASEAGGTLLTVSARIIFVRRINPLIRALIDRCGCFAAIVICCPAGLSCLIPATVVPVITAGQHRQGSRWRHA